MNVDTALNRLAKWRKFFVSWQIGTRELGDREAAAITHHVEMSILMRAELNAVIKLLIDTGTVTSGELEDAITVAALALSETYAKAYPGWAATDAGMTMKMPDALNTMIRLNFPL
jgi:hypothetical protein